MSLILAFPATDGVILATDGQLNHGQVREPGQQIFRLTQRSCWSGTGELALIQRVNQQLLPFQDSTQSLRELMPTIGTVIKSAVRDLLSMDFRSELLGSNINALTQLHRADFVFIEWTNSPLILHLSIIGSPEWLTDRPYILGPGDVLVGSNYAKYQHLRLNRDSSSILAYRLLDEAIQSGVYGLGSPIEIWQATSEGARERHDEEMNATRKTLATLKEHEVMLFEKQLTQTTSH